MLLALLAATRSGPPADTRFGIILLVLVLIGGIAMTAIVFVRNRRPTAPPKPHPDPPDLPD